MKNVWKHSLSSKLFQLPGVIIFEKSEKNTYIPVVTLLIEDKTKLSQQLENMIK